jgi:hypothetical protein
LLESLTVARADLLKQPLGFLAVWCHLVHHRPLRDQLPGAEKCDRQTRRKIGRADCQTRTSFSLPEGRLLVHRLRGGVATCWGKGDGYSCAGPSRQLYPSLFAQSLSRRDPSVSRRQAPMIVFRPVTFCPA